MEGYGFVGIVLAFAFGEALAEYWPYIVAYLVFGTWGGVSLMNKLDGGWKSCE